ncbi:MAG TPA: hypothetical protein PLV42_10025 [bacterium]|nr:hypothetical protein [bacterium]
MRSLYFLFIVFASCILAAEPIPAPDLSADLRAAAAAIGAGNGTDLELAIATMRKKLDDAGVSDDPAAALTLLDLTAGPGAEKLRSVTGRYAVILAPHLPEAHLRHTDRLRTDGFGARYWISALGDLLKALDHPLFMRPIAAHLRQPLSLGVPVGFLLLLSALFLRRREALRHIYVELPGAPLIGIDLYAFLSLVIAASAVIFDSGATFILLTLAALLFPALIRRERALLLVALFFLITTHAAVVALDHLPPPPPHALTTAADLFSLSEPGAAERPAPAAGYLLYPAARSWLFRYALTAFMIAAIFFLVAGAVAFFALSRRASFCATCGTPMEPGENATDDPARCIICEHIAQRQRQARESEIRRYREQTALPRLKLRRRALWTAWLIPGAGLIMCDRSIEGAFYLFAITTGMTAAAVWLGIAPFLAPYRPPTILPATALIAIAVILYLFSVLRTYRRERHS